MNHDQSLRDHVLYVLRGEGAHVTFEDFVADFPLNFAAKRLRGLPYTAWQVLEHMRIAQWDILEFSSQSKTRLAEMAGRLLAATDQLGTPELWQETVSKFGTT